MQLSECSVELSVHENDVRIERLNNFEFGKLEFFSLVSKLSTHFGNSSSRVFCEEVQSSQCR